MGISYRSYIGQSSNHFSDTLPTPANGNLSFNTPVGSCIDRLGRVWVADTAHNRLVILDKTLEQVLQIYGTVGSGAQQFNMPFRLLAHPNKNWIYVTDIGNKRVHILNYDDLSAIEPINHFGNSATVELKGPNGIVYHEGKLCVADEFYEGENGESRLVIFDELGQYLYEIKAITGPTLDEPLHLLWPQGLSIDEKGLLYIANTGFNTVIRCDWKGQSMPFSATNKPYIDGLELARDVSVIQGRILIPGAEANSIAVYGLNGRRQGLLQGFFAPIQITAFPESNRLLITEPILASVQLHEINLRALQKDNQRSTLVLKSIGDERDQFGQLHFVTSTAGELSTLRPSSTPTLESPLERLIEQQQSLQEQVLKALQPEAMPAWLSMSLSWQTEWLQRWQRSWINLFIPKKELGTSDVLWMVDAGNYQLQASDKADVDSARKASLPLLPGSLGIVALKPSTPLPNQYHYDSPLLVVSNFLSGIVTIYQYYPPLDELIPYTVFGALGSEPWQLSKPQGIAVDPTTNDILIADSGNNRISRWRLNAAGIVGLVDVFGRLGDQEGEFHTPSDITVDMQGHCYVSDQFNNRIQVFDGNGQFLRSWGQAGYGSAGDNFLLPTSIEHDRGYIFVSDLVNRAIKVFNIDGQFINSFSGFGADQNLGQMWMPYLMHVKNGKIYLPDCALNRINLYQFEPE
ncbi:NHL repeat-containing protein [Oceanospirillum multiglobuliferum]|uniref:SMP-30/Gluconolactonase/LRE-like region domain-containing protein n=1 Tax=Oceanospirillum multiglobuliferum TaxID=64969 RepID=A0A1T4KNR1_9GAMM|nr:NHL repeat-containing protein [Oceanospirillum multiglobuliferum]OPX56086.1 hypothetical protein BTE48_05940 [Oceanospirillum multiglobuliferum]SJZ44050.1 NHL repeat-containing protein [Oceanospirillum multiglobuliferum]